MATTTIHPDALVPGIRGSLYVAEQTIENTVDLLCETVISDRNLEVYHHLGQSPGMTRKGDSTASGSVTPVYTELTNASFTVVNHTWWEAMEVEREDLEDDKSNSLAGRISEMAISAASHPTELLYERVINAAAETCYDGTTFFYASHPARKNEGGVQSNIATKTGNTTSAVATDFNTALAKMMTLKDENGRRFHKRIPKNFILLHPPSMSKSIEEALGASIISNTSNVQTRGFRVTPIAAPELEANDSDDWYLFNAERKPFVFQKRRDWEVLRDTQGSYSFDTHRYRYQVNGRYNVHFKLWQDAVKVAG